MTTNRSTLSTWDADRDEVFFRIVQGAFPASFLAAATALLTSYDDVCTAAEVAPGAGRQEHQPGGAQADGSADRAASPAPRTS